eukprot:NODE_736_length_4341_cov_0.251297.p3 type:complete len:162 gc:universal NODE_736_length_4341_cov_0.251297:425-910(+)
MRQQNQLPLRRIYPNQVVPSKQDILDHLLAKTSRQTYNTYQKQFIQYCEDILINPLEAGTDNITDFFYKLFISGKTARTVDQAKSGLVNFFKSHNILPNPAQMSSVKEYVQSNLKYTKVNNIDEEIVAYPLSVYQLGLLINNLSESHPFIGSMFRFLFCAG